MKWTISQKGLILVSIPLLFQLVFLLLVARMQEENARAQQLAANSQEVITQVHTVLANLLTSESELRGGTCSPATPTLPGDSAARAAPFPGNYSV